MVRAADTSANTEVGIGKARLLFGNNAPTFVTAQDLAARLTGLLGLPLTYDNTTDPSNPTLYFELPVTGTLATFDKTVPLNFDLDLSPLGDLSTEASIKIQGSAGMANMRIGVSLGDAQPSTLLTTNTALSALNSGDGVDIKTTPSLLGANVVPGTTWVLSSNATFKVYRDSNPVDTVTLLKSVTLNNTSETDLLDDINNRLKINGVENQQLSTLGLSASIVDSRIQLTTTGATTDFASRPAPAIRRCANSDWAPRRPHRTWRLR